MRRRKRRDYNQLPRAPCGNSPPDAHRPVPRWHGLRFSAHRPGRQGRGSAPPHPQAGLGRHRPAAGHPNHAARRKRDNAAPRMGAARPLDRVTDRLAWHCVVSDRSAGIPNVADIGSGVVVHLVRSFVVVLGFGSCLPLIAAPVRCLRLSGGRSPLECTPNVRHGGKDSSLVGGLYGEGRAAGFQPGV